MRVLVVEDEPLMAEAIRDGLRLEAIAADIAGDGDTALELLSINGYDIAVLDRDIPGPSGDDVAAHIVRSGSGIPILMLTAADRIDDKATGFELGADDYLTKPFDLPELEARVRAQLRRGSAAVSPVLQLGKLAFDTVGRRVSFEGQPIELSARELAVLEVLMLRAGRVVSKETIVSHLYGWGDEVGLNAIEVYVYRIRRKLEPLGCEIRTVRGMGYLMERSHGAP
jgi:two-component system OmpR family response regulator